MPKFTVAICGAGIAGLCLAAELQKDKNIRVDVYESSTKFEEIQAGANVTLWGRVCEALRSMELSDDCIQASMATTSNTSATRFRLRGTGELDRDFGTLPFRSAWGLRRADLIHILRRRISPSRIRLSKRLVRYIAGSTGGPTKLEFADGTAAACDVLIASDGIRSVVRTQMMKELAESSRNQDYLHHVEPRWSGTVVYRTLIPTAFLIANFPDHPLLSGGQIYLGPQQHIIAQPVSDSLINLAVSMTFSPQDGSRWPYPAWSTKIDKKTCKRKIARHFANWEGEVRCVVDAIDYAVECAVMDIEPLPCYAKGCVALIGDAAHAAVPYLGANTALAIEDAFVLARVLRDKGTVRETLSLALSAFQHVRRIRIPRSIQP
ncbi:hypothetical protein M422DRAFT_776847 [Sphaerobolus stellatus SS14]|nr:hypothetical protein M422DRAFT_776847 [Sphaerobolus stellatus SS14]